MNIFDSFYFLKLGSHRVAMTGLEFVINNRLAWNVEIRLPCLLHTEVKETLLEDPQASSLHVTSPNPLAREGYALCHPEHTGSQARQQEHSGQQSQSFQEVMGQGRLPGYASNVNFWVTRRGLSCSLRVGSLPDASG